MGEEEREARGGLDPALAPGGMAPLRPGPCVVQCLHLPIQDRICVSCHMLSGVIIVISNYVLS